MGYPVVVGQIGFMQLQENAATSQTNHALTQVLSILNAGIVAMTRASACQRGAHEAVQRGQGCSL